MVLNVLYGNCWVNYGWLNLYGSTRNQDRGSVDWIDLLLWKKPLCRVPIVEKMSFGQVVVPLVTYRFPLAICSRSMASNRDLKFPAPNPEKLLL